MQNQTWDQRERRKLLRVPNSYDVFVRDEQSTVSGKTRDVNAWGMGFYSNRAVSVGKNVDLSIFIMDEGLNYDARGIVRHCTELMGDQAQTAKYLVGFQFMKSQEQALPFVEVPNQSFGQVVSHTISIDAPMETVYRMITDIERFKDWGPGIESAKVLERYPDGRCKRVEFEHQFLFLKVRYIDEYAFDDNNFVMSWKNAGGGSEIAKNIGGYTLKSLGPNKTAITFQADITLSFVPSRRLVNYFATSGVRKALKSFKTLVESQLKK